MELLEEEHLLEMNFGNKRVIHRAALWETAAAPKAEAELL